ncbi:MAG: aspartate kinase [Candidatus Latescibacteria bacterium 4484_181]|nr:MAG: aspartate kinase [Candidatus Latescibacteria bacterium 4484_181]RKY69015.1 MAG: aspartate kinase [Candidatus Latescibacterota bacterium]RKY74026.1 MAG: aspartate kinase [Candidatus Latescibacterota bacterium]
MNLIVQKYGGTSVATPELIKRAALRIVSLKKKGYDVAVVISAMGDTTDRLLNLATKITDRPSGRELDMLLSSGERVAMALLSMAINSMGFPAISFTGSQSGIVTDTVHTKARIKAVRPYRVQEELKKGKIVVVAGFQGVSPEHEVTTLGRGGSDTTAVALAYALGAEQCEILTDVDGVYTADPRIVPRARKLDAISYDEMLELASSGAKVLHTRSVELAKQYKVLLHVRSSFNENPGTIVKEEEKQMEEILVRGIAYDDSEAKVTIREVPDRPGVAARIFGSLAQANINVDMIIQNVSDSGTTDMSFTVPESELLQALGCIEKLRTEMEFKDVVADNDIAKVSIVGLGMRSHSGVAARMFQALAEKGINIEMISTSEIKISCVVRRPEVEEAVKALHKAFELE